MNLPEVEINRHINKQCISIGFTFDWNHDIAIEIDFLKWRFDITLVKWAERKSVKKRRQNNGFPRNIENI